MIEQPGIPRAITILCDCALSCPSNPCLRVLLYETFAL